MNNITNRQAICEALLKHAANDKDLIVCCSDSRGSASLTPFANEYPKQFVEIGIAEQNLVSVSAGLAAAGKKVFEASPACFLSTRSYEQAKVDVAYSNTNVKLIGISGGVSYGALGMTHHSVSDIAAFNALPGMRVYLPSDRFQTTRLIEELLKDNLPAYIRVSRTASKDIYDENINFTLNKANVLLKGKDCLLVACGEMTAEALSAAHELNDCGISTGVIDMHCLKPFDEKTLLEEVSSAKLVVTIEEHSPYGGLGSLVCQALSLNNPKKVVQLALPDSHLIAGTNREIFKYYGLDKEGIVQTVKKHM